MKFNKCVTNTRTTANNTNYLKSVLLVILVFGFLFGGFTVADAQNKIDQSLDGLKPTLYQGNTKIQNQGNTDAQKPKPVKAKISVGVNFCNNLDNLTQKIITNQEKWTKKKSELLAKIQTRIEEQQTKILENRARWDANRVQHFDLLTKKAGDDEVKVQAVQAFQSAIEKAIKNRRLSTDQALTGFYNALRNQALTSLEGIESARNEFNQKVRIALSVAKTNCEAGESVKTIRQNLKTAFQEAKNQFTSTANQFRNRTGKNGSIVSDYVSLKNQKIQEAHSVFQQALVQARANLLKAFGVNINQEK